jgi:hypothetical protein
MNELEATMKAFDKYADKLSNNVPVDGTDELAGQVRLLSCAISDWMTR